MLLNSKRNIMAETYNGYLTKNFSYPEMIKSSTADRLGISNDATREHVINLVNVCNFILQPVRNEFGPIRVNSGYRSPAVSYTHLTLPTKA